MNTRPRRHAARVCFPFVGDSVGGSHISAAYLIRDLDPDHYEPVVGVHQDGPLRPFLDGLGLRHRLIEISAFAETTPSIADTATSVARTAPALRRFLIDDDIDIVHTNDLRMNLTWPLPVVENYAGFIKRLLVGAAAVCLYINARPDRPEGNDFPPEHSYGSEVLAAFGPEFTFQEVTPPNNRSLVSGHYLGRRDGG